MNDTLAIEQRAALWRARLDAPGWSEQDQAELDAWLDVSTAHRVAWLRMEYGWRRTDRLAALRVPAPGQRSDRPFRYRRLIPALAATLGAIAIGLLAFAYLADDTQRYATGVGERETVTLDDSSRLELNTATQMRTQVGKRARKVWLDRGEAYFEIVHDEARPFVVHVAERRVVVLGTRFSVRNDGSGLRVAVADGRVRIEAPAAAGGAPIVATHGEIVVAQANGAPQVIHSADRVDDELAWRRGLLVFDNATLAEAVVQFNRYNRKQLAVGDPKVAGTRISGSFDATNPDAFVRLLGRAYGLRIEDRGDRIDIAE